MTARALLGLIAVVALVFAAMRSPVPPTAPEPGASGSPSTRDSPDTGVPPPEAAEDTPPPSAEPTGPDLLLPDMRSLEPRTLQVERTAAGRLPPRRGAP